MHSGCIFTLVSMFIYLLFLLYFIFNSGEALYHWVTSLVSRAYISLGPSPCWSISSQDTKKLIWDGKQDKGVHFLPLHGVDWLPSYVVQFFSVLPEVKVSYLLGYQECVCVSMSWCVHSRFIVVYMHVMYAFEFPVEMSVHMYTACACDYAWTTIHKRRKKFYKPAMSFLA